MKHYIRSVYNLPGRFSSDSFPVHELVLLVKRGLDPDVCPVHTPDDIRKAFHRVESSLVLACLPLVGPHNELVHSPEEGVCHSSYNSTNRRLVNT